MVVEAVASLSTAWMRRSPALLGFGGDSAVELLSAAVVLRRFYRPAQEPQAVWLRVPAPMLLSSVPQYSDRSQVNRQRHCINSTLRVFRTGLGGRAGTAAPKGVVCDPTQPLRDCLRCAKPQNREMIDCYPRSGRMTRYPSRWLRSRELCVLRVSSMAACCYSWS